MKKRINVEKIQQVAENLKDLIQQLSSKLVDFLISHGLARVGLKRAKEIALKEVLKMQGFAWGTLGDACIEYARLHQNRTHYEVLVRYAKERDPNPRGSLVWISFAGQIIPSNHLGMLGDIKKEFLHLYK